MPPGGCGCSCVGIREPSLCDPSHFVGLLETKLKECRFARIDSDAPGNLIPKEEEVKPELSEDDKKALDELIKGVLPDGNAQLLRQVTDLALLANGMLKGKALADFIARSEDLLK